MTEKVRIMADSADVIWAGVIRGLEKSFGKKFVDIMFTNYVDGQGCYLKSPDKENQEPIIYFLILPEAYFRYRSLTGFQFNFTYHGQDFVGKIEIRMYEGVANLA